MAEENKTAFENHEEAIAEIARLQRNLQRSRQDNKVLAAMNENAERLRRINEAEKNLQYLYNDLLLENVPNMLFLFDEQQRLVICSSACEPLLKTTNRAAVKGKSFYDLFAPSVDPKFVLRLREDNLKVLIERKYYEHDDAIEAENGNIVYLQVAIAPIEDSEGNCKGTILSLNNVTELTEMKQKAEEAARSKSSFLSNMSHEIRTPMNAIKGLSELLSLTSLDTLQRNYVNNILASSATLINIINDILDFSAIDSRKLELIDGPYSLGEMLAEVASVGGMRNASKDIKLMMGTDPNMPSMLLGDDVRIKQVLVNLINNAVKYTYEGHIWVKIKTEPNGSGVKLVCSVEDTGVGIKEESIKHLFDAFSRADLQTNRHIAGAGLGLTIVKYLVQAMGGEIWVESEYGKGSTFGFWVPQRIVNAAPLASVQDAGSINMLLIADELRMVNIRAMLDAMNVRNSTSIDGAELGGKEKYTHILYDDTIPPKVVRRLRKQNPKSLFAVLRNMQGALMVSEVDDTVLFVPLLVGDLVKFLDRRYSSEKVKEQTLPMLETLSASELQVVDTKILVVDDNEINLMVSSEMLLTFSADVECADGGQEALDMCAHTKYDIIFLDHMMPGIDGIEVTSRLRRDEGLNRQTPIIALTANVAENIESYYVRCGMDDYIAKPVSLNDLTRVLERWLPQQKLVSRTQHVPMAYAITPWAGKKNAATQKAPSDKLLACMEDIGEGLATNDNVKVLMAMRNIKGEEMYSSIKDKLDLMVKALDAGDLAGATHHYADTMSTIKAEMMPRR